jgi:hypothetical protein
VPNVKKSGALTYPETRGLLGLSVGVTFTFTYEENNQQNALIVSLINLLISNYSNMFRPLS